MAVNPVSPAVRDLARWLFEHEVAAGESCEKKTHGAFRVCDKLRNALSTLAGIAGYKSLLDRALTLAKADVHGLDAYQVNAQGHLEIPEGAEPKQDIDETINGEIIVVAQMQAVFMDNWIKVSGDVLHGPEYFPPLQPVGAGKAHVFSSSSSGGSESMRLMYLLAITAASRSIHLSTPYFIPDALTIKALTDAVKRGVTVQIITVGKHADSETVRRASRARWGALLEAGVEIHEYQPTMYHCKVMIVDGLWTTVGSTNFDPRSISLNDEANLNYNDVDFARRQIEIFQKDLARSRQVTLQEWKDRPFAEKLWEHAASLFGSQL